MYARRQRPSEPRVYRDAAFLSSCTDEDAVAWLTERRFEASSVVGKPDTPSDSPVLEYILYRRNSRRLDLALAESGRSQTVLERVYRRSASAIRVVACSNPSLFLGGDSFSQSGSSFMNQIEAEGRQIYIGKDGKPIAPAKVPLFWKIITNGPLNELRALCENLGLTSGMYLGLIGSWEGDEESNVVYRISTERFRNVIQFLAGNPRIRTPRDESADRYYLDGFAEYEYNQLFSKLWMLAGQVPVTREWAACLSSVYSKLVPAPGAIEDPATVISRWSCVDAPCLTSVFLRSRQGLRSDVCQASERGLL